MYLGYHWSITMEMMSCQSTGRTKTRKKVNRWSTRTQNITLGIHEVIFVYTVSQVSNLFENIQPPNQSEMWLYTKNRKEIPDSPVLQDPSLTLNSLMYLADSQFCFPVFLHSLGLCFYSYPIILVLSDPYRRASPRRESDGLTCPVKSSDWLLPWKDWIFYDLAFLSVFIWPLPMAFSTMLCFN